MRSLRSLSGLTVLAIAARGAENVPLSSPQAPGIHDAAPGLALSDLIDAVDRLQDVYFNQYAGTWPESIDWTSAVLGTHIPATLQTFSNIDLWPTNITRTCDELINTYFVDELAYYHIGQQYFLILGQAYDDILWVVLQWLVATTFIEGQNARAKKEGSGSWYGTKYIAPFAHRARIFWEAAEEGWDEELCGGGMTWNPKLTPYKNAITNELWIAASAAMYIHFPGDDNDAPLTAGEVWPPAEQKESDSVGAKDWKYPPHDPRYLMAATKGYRWLYSSNMTNAQGLFVDGFHISGWQDERHPGSRKCDERDETVYTYNQGVILSAQHNLYLATGDYSYLQDGHTLIQNVMRATGWDVVTNQINPSPTWQGLGRLGVLEDACDSSGECSQDAQTFKSIFFLHFEVFCSALPVEGDEGFGFKAPAALAKRHAEHCASYGYWVVHNANAAARTRDGDGLFSMWWTEQLVGETGLSVSQVSSPVLGADVKNKPIPNDGLWRLELVEENGPVEESLGSGYENMAMEAFAQTPLSASAFKRGPEIQSGGISVLRAAIESDNRARKREI